VFKGDGKVDLVPLFGEIPNTCDDMRGGTYEGLVIGSGNKLIFYFLVLDNNELPVLPVSG